VETAAGRVVPGQYIVVFRRGTPDPAGLARSLTAAHGGSLRFTYTTALQGFAAGLSDRAVAALRDNPNVSYVEPDQVVEAIGSGTQSPATWGLDRIDQRDLPLDSTYGYDDDGVYDGVNPSQPVLAYIIDTGIRTSHSEFGGRASIGFDAIGDGQNGNDCHGHGTHVAGTVGGSTYGVAKAVSLKAVRVLNCSGSGTWAQVIAGIDWVTGDHDPTERGVANMSLGGGYSQATNDAVTNSVTDGVVYSIAAGNSAGNACNYSPASTPSALTIGATTNTDARASYSNYGTCLDLFAPGSSVTSAWNTSDVATNTISGTSMAAPHVAGAAALYMGLTGESAPTQVGDAIVGYASTGKVGNAGTGSPNLLLYTRFEGGELPPPPPPPPPPAISLTARGYKVKGKQKVELTWTPSTLAVTVYRDGAYRTTDNASPYVDAIDLRGSGTYRHKVCETANLANCSNETTTTF
jgi:subtilisin family serine protease